MKKTLIFICTLFVLLMVFAVGCSKNTTVKTKAGIQTEKITQNQQEDIALMGDANGDGQVNIDDVTLIQRVLAGLVADKDGKIVQRCDIDGNGLDIKDATAIQEYLAGFDNIYHYGEPITEKASESVTGAVAENTKEVPQTSVAEIPVTQEPTEGSSATTATTESQSRTDTKPQTSTEEKETIGITLGENDLPFDDL